MKTILSFAVAMASITALAQTNPAANTTTATPAAGSSINTNAAPVTAIGTSTASVEQKPADDKKWSASLVLQGETNTEGAQRIGEQTITTLNYLGAGYKVTKDTKIGVRQYFGYGIGRDSNGEIDTQWTVATVGTKFAGMLGSDEIAPLFWYYLPTQTALENVYSKTTAVEHNGILRMDAEVVWTLNPKWSVSYYFNPRQSIVPEKQVFLSNAGKAAYVESTTTLIHYGVLYYNVNDAIQPYTYVGMDNRMSTDTLTSMKDHALLAIGANFTMLGGKFILNPEIYNEVALKDEGQYAEAPKWLQSEDINYQLTAVVAF